MPTQRTAGPIARSSPRARARIPLSLSPCPAPPCRARADPSHHANRQPVHRPCASRLDAPLRARERGRQRTQVICRAAIGHSVRRWRRRRRRVERAACAGLREGVRAGVDGGSGSLDACRCATHPPTPPRLPSIHPTERATIAASTRRTSRGRRRCASATCAIDSIIGVRFGQQR